MERARRNARGGGGGRGRVEMSQGTRTALIPWLAISGCRAGACYPCPAGKCRRLSEREVVLPSTPRVVTSVSESAEG